MVEVVSGLAPGDSVITTGLMQLRPDRAVSVQHQRIYTLEANGPQQASD